ncbi:MAG: tetratricopeptide repeat protein [Phycisphaeraceae bacterium]|nr:tetratricopeptide repeat protein [Phycisphaeraceae bacterium]MCW5754175.1 tetratricopeptide repeat protein [Phycisphaeraceae bacterium]
MTAEELIKQGRIDEALSALKAEVKAKPAEAGLRVFLFQVLAINGDWDRALTQLNVAAEMDGQHLLMTHLCRPALQAEAFRRDVFAGTRTPMLFGEPEPWMGWLVQANAYFGQGKFAAAAELRDKAFEAAPAIGGSLNGEPFDWIADMDGRLGPVLEVLIDGKYYWLPLCRVRQLLIEPPGALRDVMWTPATLVLANGGQVAALIFSRYAGSERSSDPMVRLGRRTEWDDHACGISTGLGQKMLASASGEYAMLEIRSFVQDLPAPTPGGGATVG